MADDRQEPREVAAAGQPGRGADEGMEQTRQFRPVDDATEAPNDPPRPPRNDEMRPQPSPDETAAFPASDETAPLPSAGEPAQRPDVGQTAPLPSADETTRLPMTPGSWSGRAQVPAPGRPAVPGPAPAYWETHDDRGDRRWWMPILIGVVALLLLGVLALGIWLITQSRGGGNEPPIPSPSPSPTPSATTQPTSAAPTTEPPTPTATTPAAVTVPPLVGFSQERAREVLAGLGLAYRLQFRSSDQPPGTVIATDPAAGAHVPVGEKITLVIAEPPTQAPTTAAPTTPAVVTPTG